MRQRKAIDGYDSRRAEAYVRGKIVAICFAILRQEMGAIAGARILSQLRFELLPEDMTGHISTDADFNPFAAIDSETDGLPVDWERRNWSAEALEEKDREILEAERWAREIAIPACKVLIERFAERSDKYSLQPFLNEG